MAYIWNYGYRNRSVHMSRYVIDVRREVTELVKRDYVSSTRKNQSL